MDEDVSPSSGQQFSAGFIVMDSQTESMDGDIMQILPALNQSNGVSSSTSSVNLRLFEDDQSCDDDKHRDSPKGQLLVTDSEFEQPPKRKIDINTSSDDVVSESEEGDITVIEKLHPEDNNSKEKGTKRKRSDSDSDGKDAQKNEEDDPGSSFHSTGRENLGSYNQAELSQSHCRGNRLPIQQVLSQADMFADITEDEGSSSQSDHISCLQLSSKPMLVPDTVDESSPTELPPSPNASSIHIIPSSPTDGSFQDTSACSNNDTSATDHTSGVDLEVEEEYNPYVSATLAEEDPKCRTKKKRDHNVEREGEDQERQNQSGKEKVDEVRTEGRSKEGSSLSGKEGGSRMESVGEYDPGGTPTLAGAELHVGGPKQHLEDTKKKTSIDSDTSVIRIEDSNETMEVISISSTQDKDLSESQHYSLHLSPSQPSQRNSMASQGNTSVQGSQSIIGKYEHINLSHGEGIERGPSPAGQSQRGQSQVGQNIGGQVQTRQTESQKGISQGFQILGKSIQGQSDSMQTQGKLIQGQSQGDLVGSQQGNQGLWHTAGKANQGMNQREVEMSQEGRAVRQKTAAASPRNSQGQVQHASEQSQGVFLQGSSPSIEVTMVTTTSQNLLATTTTKLPNRGDSQEPGPSHAITPPVKSTPRYQTDSDDIKVETMDLAFSLERPQIDGTSEVGLSEDSRTEVFRRNKDKDSKKTIIKDASDEDENLVFHRLSGESSSVKSEEIQGGGGTSPKANPQRSVYSQDTIPSDVSTALQMGSVEVLGSQPAGLQKAVPKDGSHMPRMQTAVSSDTGYKVEESVQQSQVMAQHQSQNSEDTELYDPNQIQGGNVSQLTSGVRVPSQSTQGNMIMHQHISVNSQGSYASQRGTVSQGHAAVQGSSQNIQGNLPVHLQGMTNMSQGGIVSQVPTIVGGPYPNISGNAYVPESVPTCTSLQSAYLTNSQGQINSSMVQPNYSQNAVGQQQINVSSPRGQLQHNLSRESQDEIRDWLTSRPSFSDRTFQERNMNTYSAYKARKASQKNSPVKAATQERIMVQQTENVMVSTDPYAFHGSQSQGLYQPNPAEINTAGLTVPTHHNPIPPLHHDTPVSTRKKRRPATRKKVTTRTRQHPIAKVHFSDQITTTASAAIETGAVIGQSTRMHMPMHSPSTSSSSDKSPRVPPLHRSSFTTPVMQSPHLPSVLAPPTSLHHTPGRSRMTDTTPSSTSAPEVDLNWVFTPSPDLTALVNLTEKSDVQQKNAIVAQMSGQPSFEIVSKIAVTGTMVKHFILREKYHGGVRKGYVVEEEEDKADIRTKYQTEVIPPVDYISPSRSTSTVSTGDLGDISSFSSGSIRSNMERSGSSLETTASLSSTVAPPVDTSRGMAVSSTTAESDIVMTTGNTGRDKNVITIAPLPSVTSTSTAPPKGQLKCSTPREDTHKGTPSLSPKQSLPSSVEADHSPQEASTIEKSGSRLFDETHQSSDLFAGTSEASADKGDTEGGKEDLVADEEADDASGRGKKQKKTVVKRGRGRPRRTTAAAVQEVEVLEEDEADEEEKDKGDNVEEKSTSGSDKVRKRIKPFKERKKIKANLKVEIVEYAKQHGNRPAGRKFGVGEKNIRLWRKNEEKLRNLPSWRHRIPPQYNRIHYPELETLLLGWVNQERAAGRALSCYSLRQEAKKFSEVLGLEHFRGSHAWLTDFRRRNGLVMDHRKVDKNYSNERNSYTLERKLEIVAYAEKHGNRPAGRMFNIDEANVRMWRRNKHRISRDPAPSTKKRVVHMYDSAVKFPEVESLVISWLVQEMEKGKIVTLQMVSEEARRIATELNIKDFKASLSWANTMLKRHNMMCHKRVCKKKNFTYKSREDKLRVIAYAEKYGKEAAMEYFDLSECTVRFWMRDKAIIQQWKDYDVKLANPGHGTKISEIQESLQDWIKEEKLEGRDVTIDNITRKAKDLGMQCGLADVRISDTWMSNYLKKEIMDDEISPPVPYQDEQSKEASGEEIGSGIIQSKPVLGARVIAKWKDKFYYPGVISRVDKARFQVKFDDGDVLLIKPHDILLIERLPIGQPVMVPTGPEAFYEGALIVGHVRQGGRTHYTVEQDGGARKQFRSSQVILNEDQAESLIKDTNCVKSGPASTADKKIADVTLDNLVEGKRRTGSKYEQGEVDNPPAPPSTQGRKRKYKVDVPPSATSTPTPNRAKRHKVEDPDITPRFGYTADSPAIPKNTRRSPRKSRIGLFDKTSAPTKKIFKGMVFLLTYVEKSSEDRKVEKDFLKDPSLSSDESASESATEELVPFDKARLKNEIEAAGGTVLACYDKDQIPLIKQCYLISNTYQRTVKYFQSLAAGIPCVSHLWIHHSVAQEKVLDYHSYMLQAGISIEKKKIIEWNSRRGVLESLCVLITSSDVKFKQQWSSVLEAAGCHVVQKLPSPTSERPVNVILADKTCTETSLRKYRELPIVGCEWVIQCLINGQRMGFDAHEHYRYDHQV